MLPVEAANPTVQLDGDWPTLSHYVNPDPDGDGLAYNGLPVYSPDEAAQQLNRTGGMWDVGPNGQIRYTFLDHAPSGHYNTRHGEAFAGAGSLVAGFSPFTAEQREATRDVIQLWDDLIAPSFVETNGRGGADIAYMNTNTGPDQAGAFTPWGDAYDRYSPSYNRFDKLQGDTFVNQEQADNFDLYPGGYGFTTLVHETGHALGLSHPGDYNAGSGGPITYPNDAEYFQDSAQYTVMSYFHAGYTGAVGYVNWGTGGYGQTAQTPMLHDIAAVQAMYGADLTTRTGDTTYGFNSNADRDVFDFTINENPFLTIYDAGGHDTLDFSGFSGVNTILNLNDGEFSTAYTRPDAEALGDLYGIYDQAFWDAVYAGRTSNPGFLSDNISIAYGTVIEDGITGSGHDRLIGNEVANRLDGGAGSDTYTGNGGADTFVFGHIGHYDYITDFESGVDRIDLSGVLGENGSFEIVDGNIFGDANGDGATDFIVVSQGDAIQQTDIYVGG